MIKGNATEPRAYPWNSARQPEQINRLNELTGNVTLNQEKMYEVGRALKLGVRKLTPATPITLNQNENLTMDFWRVLANKVDPGTGGEVKIDLDDIKGERIDISASLTDEDESFKGTVYFSNMRVNNFAINIGNPDAKIERTFDLVGEYCRVIVDNYLAYAEKVAVGASEDITFGGTGEPPVPLEDIIFRVLRVSDDAVSEVESNSYSYVGETGGIGTLTVTGCEVDDLIKVYYPAADAYTDLWEDNVIDPLACYADQCEIYLRIGEGTAQKLYRIQSANIAGAFDRKDYKEIGNRDVVQTGVSAKTVTVTLGRILEDFTLEQILADLADPSDSKIIDVEKLSASIGLVVKMYTDNLKTDFAMGIRIDNLSPTTLKPLSAKPEAMNEAENALESDNFLVTTSIDDLELV